jgi:V8-like Glu-specific endopeptidase
MAARSSWTGAFLAVATAGCAPGASSATEAVIFGADDRVEVHEVTNAALREAVIRAVPAMIRADRVNVDPSTNAVTFDVNRLGPSRELCEGEAHYDQPTAPSCSATLIDDDLVLTAGHCVDGWDCRDQRFVFGWYYDAEGEIHARTGDDVFACAEVVVTENTAANDYAIVRLDRAAPGPPMEVRTTPVVTGEPVSLAGYPFGLPMKVVESGIVNGSISASRFYARLDAQPGNSGSGVYDADLRVLGDLTNGPVAALVRDGDCNRLAVIGDDVSRTELISSIIPAITALCASGHESERLCGVCGDETCDALEDCPADCTPDAGPGRDASVIAPDAGTSPDASNAPRDALISDDGSLGSDAGNARLATHCGCRAGARSDDASLGAVLAAVALGLVGVRIRRVRRAEVW